MNIKDAVDNFINDNRIIYISGQINEAIVESTVKQLLYFNSQNADDIIIILDSYGGYVDSFIAIHDAITMSRCKINTLCIGKAMSAAQMILISGSNGKRFITKNSRVMIHEISAGHNGKLSSIKNEYEETTRLQKTILKKLILKYTKITEKQLDIFFKKDSYLTAEQCIKYGICDHILTSPDMFYNIIDKKTSN